MAPIPMLRTVNGHPALDDPSALGMVQAVDAYNLGVAYRNCEVTFREAGDRVRHFARRIMERGLSPSDVVIVLIRVDDLHGGPLAEALMPGHDWDAIRASGMKPYARGLAGREGIQEVLGKISKQAAEQLRSMVGRVAVVVVDDGIAAVFEGPELG